MPVSSTSPERTFSKLKILKNRLRTTISQDRLEDLMITTCESDVQINNEDVTNIFASLSSTLSKNLTYYFWINKKRNTNVVML